MSASCPADQLHLEVKPAHYNLLVEYSESICMHGIIVVGCDCGEKQEFVKWSLANTELPCYCIDVQTYPN